MAGKVFLNYRRDDSKFAAGRLFDRLRQSFADEDLFMDVDNIEAGTDFKKVLDEQVAGCDVFLAIIGPSWLTLTGPDGRRRLDIADDFVRIEIEAALKRGIRVIPVLVDRAAMPLEQDLPESIRALAARQARPITHERFGLDCTDLAKQLNLALHEARVKRLGVFGRLASLWDRSSVDEPVTSSRTVELAPTVSTSVARGILRVINGTFWVAVVGVCVAAPYIAKDFGARPPDPNAIQIISGFIGGALLVVMLLVWLVVRKNLTSVGGLAFAVNVIICLAAIGHGIESAAPEGSAVADAAMGTSVAAGVVLVLYLTLKRLGARARLAR